MKLEIPIGTYNAVAVDFLKRTEIKGCVEGLFREEPDQQEDHKYCTRVDHSSYGTQLSQNEDFEDRDAEWMAFEIVIDDNEFNRDEQAEKQITYKLDDVVVDEDSEVELTMLIDLKRLLRFYNRGPVDQGPNPGMPTDRS